MQQDAKDIRQLFAAVAVAVDRAAQHASGMERWLIGSLPPGIPESAEAVEASLRGPLSRVTQGSFEERYYQRALSAALHLRIAYRAASDCATLLPLARSEDQRVGSNLVVMGTRLSGLCSEAIGAVVRLEKIEPASLARSFGRVEAAHDLILRTAPRPLSWQVRVERAAAQMLVIAADGVARAALRILIQD